MQRLLADTSSVGTDATQVMLTVSFYLAVAVIIWGLLLLVEQVIAHTGRRDEGARRN